MLRVIEMRGDAAQTEMARQMLVDGRKVRDERAAFAAAPMVPAGGHRFVVPNFAEAAPVRNLVREVYDGGNSGTLPGALVRAEGQPATGDPAVDGAYDGAGAVYDLYFDQFGRDSLDGLGLKLLQTVHHRRAYNNAFWDGAQMVYGDGDQQIFSTFVELSVIGHEMTHGVVQFSGGLVYEGQSGALNESFADVFGSMVRQYVEGTDVHASDWLVGKGILGPEINGQALRSMRLPGTAYADALLGQDPQPYHMDLYVNTTEDNGGVHINSGIPNHAFYLFCMLLGGNAWGPPGQIWYRALQQLNNPFASFADWAGETMEAAIELYRTGSTEVIALRRAWKLVGISV
jgi:Zn-dependent metalloprotease